MSFFEKVYMVTDYYGNMYLLTAKELYERIMQDSKSDYNWIAPARELVRICKKTGFPAEYSLAIKIAILNCFANIEHKTNCGFDRPIHDSADEEAVQYCYNSLYGIDTEEAVSARKRYLTEMINAALYIKIHSSLYHPGPTFRKIHEDFAKSKFEEYISQEKIDFKQLAKTLRSSFSKIIETAEVNGDFDEDEKKDRESWKIFFQKLKDI